MLSFTLDEGQYAAFDFSGMTPDELLALRDKPFVVKIVNGNAKLSFLVEPKVKIFRDVVLRRVSPDAADEIDTVFETADDSRHQRKHAEQAGHEKAVPAAVPVLLTATELAAKGQLPKSQGVRDPRAWTDRKKVLRT